jgi:polygalacturonase
MKKLFLIFLFHFIFFHVQINAQDFNITNYGAIKNDTSRLNTMAINKTVEACFTAGGGRVVIPSGYYKSGTIILKNNVELYLAAGAVLFASKNHRDFPRQAQPAYRSQKDPGGWYALIYAEGASNIGIRGKGTIDGQGASQQPQPELLGGDRDGRPRNILFISCKDVSIEGITMTNSGNWNQHYLNCEDVIVNDIRVFNHSNKNNDGIDIDDCSRFILSNSIIDSDDDGIVLKSTGNAGCKDIVITNCLVSSYTNAIKCGTESTGGFKNIAISNCVIKPTRSAVASKFGLPRLGIAGISLELVDGGIMEGVNVNNVVIEGTQCPIYVRLGNRARKHVDNAPVPPLGQMKNIQINNITAYNTGNFSSSITGLPNSKIENISLNNIRIINKGGIKNGDYLVDYTKVKEDEKGYPQPTVWGNLPSYGFFIRHVKNISLSNVTLGSLEHDIRIPVIGVDIEKLFVTDLKLDISNDAPNFLLKDVKEYKFNGDTVQVIK